MKCSGFARGVNSNVTTDFTLKRRKIGTEILGVYIYIYIYKAF